MVRWYAVGVLSGKPYISPISGRPVVFLAPDKWAATAHVDRCWPQFGLKPRSVMEHEALTDTESAAKRMLDKYDVLFARARAEEALREQLVSGQISFCSEPSFWRER